MHFTHGVLPLCLGLLNFNTGMLPAVLISIAGIVLAGVITVSAMYFQHQQKQMLHETARLALEKGQPLSHALIETLSKSPAHQHRSVPRNDIRSGLILIAVGVGLYLFFAYMEMGGLRFVGAIPGLIGVAILLYGILEPLFARQNPDRDRGSQP